MTNNIAREALKIRLNMVDWIGENTGIEQPCPLCEQELDTTEHVFACSGGDTDINRPKVKDLEDGRRMEEIVELFRENEQKRREKLFNNIMLALDE